MIKLSVVITCYNKGQFLKRCLDSCVKQNSQEVEFIIVDDGSTDNSKEIYNKYKDVRFHAYYKENGGVSSARNFGIEKSQGKYITFLDADDEYPENAVRTMIRYSNEEPIYEFNHKRQWGNYTPLLKKTIPAGCYELRDHKTCFWAVWNKTFRRDFLNENKLRFDTNCNYGEDEVFIIECLAKCRYYKHIWAINLIRHFDDKKSLVHTLSSKGVLEQWTVEKKIEKRLQRTNPEYAELVKDIIKKHEDSIIYRKRLNGLSPQEFLNAQE